MVAKKRSLEGSDLDKVTLPCMICGKPVTFKIMRGLKYCKHRACPACKLALAKGYSPHEGMSSMRSAQLPESPLQCEVVYKRGDAGFDELAKLYKPPKNDKRRKREDPISDYRGIVDPDGTQQH